MAPHANFGVQIGTVDLRTYAIDCFDWSDLLQTSKRGDDRPIPGVSGRAVRPRVADYVRAALPVRLNGAFDGNTAVTSGQHEKVYDHVADLLSLAALSGTQTLTFHYGSGKSVSVDCVVEAVTAPQFESPSIALVVVDVTLPDGPLVLT